MLLTAARCIKTLGWEEMCKHVREEMGKTVLLIRMGEGPVIEVQGPHQFLQRGKLMMIELFNERGVETLDINCMRLSSFVSRKWEKMGHNCFMVQIMGRDPPPRIFSDKVVRFTAGLFDYTIYPSGSNVECP